MGLPPGVDPMIAAGTPGGPGGSQQEPMAIASLVCGVASLPLFACCGLFALGISAIGVVLGIVSLSRFKGEPNYSGKPLAIAGLVLNALVLLTSILLTIFAFGMVGIGILSGP